MIDFQESPIDGDIFLDEDGDFSMIEGPDEVGQAVVCQVEMPKGDWFLDLNEGTNHRDKIFAKTATKADAEMELRRSTKKVFGVRNIYKMQIVEDDSENTARALGEIDTIYGRTEQEINIG